MMFTADRPEPGDILRSLGLTLVFNTVIALILTSLVLTDEAFFDVLVISQFMGLSIWLSVHAGLHFWLVRGKAAAAFGIASGLTVGIILGSVLSFGFLSVRHHISAGFFFWNVLVYTAAFGVIFGIPIIYFFTSWSRIQSAEKAVRDEKIRRLTLEKEAGELSLKILQAQIEPHFLFNTLSHIQTLLDTDLRTGKEMLYNLNSFLRTSLHRTRKPMVTLAQELELIRHYLTIYKIRMGKRLDFSIQDETASQNIAFPPMIIQPLVENAVKHGIEPGVDGGSITITCRREQGRLFISVADTGMGMDDTGISSGVGIDNVSRRLKTIYGESARLTLQPNSPKGVRAVIEVAI